MATWYGSTEPSSDSRQALREAPKASKEGGWLKALAAGCSNFSIQYNYQGASIAMAIMSTKADRYVAGGEADFPASPWVQKTLLCVVFEGSVAGMLCMGVIGDLLGHRRALMLTKALVVCGAFMCTLLPSVASDGFWHCLALARFIIGVGLGGAYPLTAVVAGGSEKVSQAFFWQSPGVVAPYLVALLLFQLMPGDTNRQFRWVLGLGAVPSLIAMLAVPQEEEVMRAGLESLKDSVSCPQLQKLLLGTAGSWFLFDVAAYGTSIFTPHILNSIFGHESVDRLALHSILLLSMSIPATLLTCVVQPVMGAKRLNLLGFGLQAALFATFAVLYGLEQQDTQVLLSLCAIYFGLNFGVAVSTYVLPIEVFPEESRGTLHGISAAAGKLGALLGAGIFPIISDQGVQYVMLLQAVVCLLGALLSYICLRP